MCTLIRYELEFSRKKDMPTSFKAFLKLQGGREANRRQGLLSKARVVKPKIWKGLIFSEFLWRWGVWQTLQQHELLFAAKKGSETKESREGRGEGQGRGGIFALHKVVWNYASTGPATRHLILLLSDPKSAH